MDYFINRYYSSTQGRFSSADPLHFQAEMLSDPQRFNLYSYVRNNPLILIDPDGEAIELSGSEAERARLLESIKQAVGKKAGQYLYENTVTDKDGNTKYFVGIRTNGPSGKGPDFKDINAVAGEIAPIVNDSKIVTLHEVTPGTTIRGVTIAPNQEDAAVGATVFNPATGNLDVYIAFSPSGPGGKNEKSEWLPLDGGKTETGKPTYRDSATVMGHELGHARGFMTGDPNHNDAARRLENKVRKLRNPKAVERTVH